MWEGKQVTNHTLSGVCTQTPGARETNKQEEREIVVQEGKYDWMGNN